jgi:hypothetical protein
MQINRRSSVTLRRFGPISVVIVALLLTTSYAGAQRVPPQAFAVTPGMGVATLAPQAQAQAQAAGSYRAFGRGAPVLDHVWSHHGAALLNHSLAEQDGGRRRLSVAGGIGGFVVGAVAGALVACHFNRDDYDVFCAGQNDTKVAVGAVIGGATGAALGAYLFRRREPAR